ncbi:MAG: membrane protein [Peptococcaceae bacterium BICA1-7]|nr:MAG: membrane protein [Peptococcaceae bacterium BICA1-7]HBV99359.1 EamA/RhaT family transporter [Desulfotomaculum sp.]
MGNVLKSGGQGLGVALVIVSTLCLSTEAIAAKIAYQGGAGVMTTLTLRYIIAAFIFWGFILAGGYPYKLSARQLQGVAALSLGAQTLTVLALFQAFQYIPAAMAILFLYLYPTIVTILAFFFLKEKITWPKGAALALTFLGAAFILGQPVGELDMRGVLLSVAAAVTNAIFLVGTARLLSGIQTPVYNAYVSSIVALAVGILALSRGQLHLDLSFQAWAAIVALGIVSTVIAMAALMRGVQIIGPSRAAIISTFEPAATALLAFWALGESLTLWQAAGGIVILAGVFLLKRKSA